jgi:transposase
MERSIHTRVPCTSTSLPCSASLTTNVIADLGATPYIAFKSIHSGAAGGLWEKMFHYFAFNRQEFLGHYHKRSNVESTFSMIKAKFRDHVRSKTDVAMTNEVLCKILCHNICCLIQAMYELGIEPTFWAASPDVEIRGMPRIG